MGCSSVLDAHIYMHHVSSVRDWWKKNESGCSWDVQDAQDALKTDPLQVSSKSDEKQKSFINSPFFCSEFQKCQ